MALPVVPSLQRRLAAIAGGADTDRADSASACDSLFTMSAAKDSRRDLAFDLLCGARA